jgi:hypothetical protein
MMADGSATGPRRAPRPSSGVVTANSAFGSRPISARRRRGRLHDRRSPSGCQRRQMPAHGDVDFEESVDIKDFDAGPTDQKA